MIVSYLWDYLKFLVQYRPEKDFVENIKILINEFKSTYSEMQNLNLKWDLFKKTIKNFCINYGIGKRNMEIKLENELNEELKLLKIE